MVKLAANRNAMRQACDLCTEALELFRNIMRCGLAIDRGIERQDHAGICRVDGDQARVAGRRRLEHRGGGPGSPMVLIGNGPSVSSCR